MPDGYRYDSPIGPLLLTSDHDQLVALRFGARADPATNAALAQPSKPPQGVLADACGQLEAYFAGQLQVFDVPLAPRGTAFQRAVWSELQRIPFGQTISYRELAERIGSPGAARAVGSANGANPIAVIVPCHRVIASDGALAGFAGGVELKRALLDHERAGAGLFAQAPA